MIPAEHVLVALAVTLLLGVAGGVRLAVWWRAGLAAPSRRAPAGRARRAGSATAAGMSRTALYLLCDRMGTVIYAGITTDVRARLAQHAADKPWAGDVARVEAWWFPDRYAALAAEWTAITLLCPRHNRAPSGSCDAWTERRPPIQRVHVEFPRSVTGLVRRALR